MNQGAQEISKLGCDAVLFLTQETVIARQTIGELAAALESDPRCGVTGPLLCRRSEPHTVWSAGGSLRGVWRGTPRHIGRGASADTIPATTADVDWLDGACLLVSREAFGAVGGFRDDLFLYWEDVDLCRRLAASGYHVRCVRSARAYQEPSMTPPYLAARNRALVLGTRGAISAAITLFKHAAADAGRGDGLRRAELELRGLLDARSGRLDRSIALERPRGCAR
jgi:GT2 family glycosyltransferase